MGVRSRKRKPCTTGQTNVVPPWMALAMRSPPTWPYLTRIWSEGQVLMRDGRRDDRNHEDDRQHGDEYDGEVHDANAPFLFRLPAFGRFPPLGVAARRGGSPPPTDCRIPRARLLTSPAPAVRHRP